MAVVRLQPPRFPEAPPRYEPLNEQQFRREVERLVSSIDEALARYASEVIGATVALGDLSDVTITSIASGEILKWNGSAWINNTLAEANIPGLSLTNTFTAINTFSSTTDFNDNILIEKTSTPKVTIKTTTQDAGGRPLLVFANNTIAQITGDDHAHQKFDFMSEPTDTRTYSAEVRIFGAGTDYSTDLLSLLHNGTDGEISTNSGKIRLIPVNTSYVEIYTDSDLPLVLKQGTTGNPWNRIEFHISDGTRRGWVGMDTAGGLNIVNNQSNVDIILQTTGTGITKISGSAYNGNHLVMGSYHLWVDATGDLRIKSSAPTSATDGTVVGTQT